MVVSRCANAWLVRIHNGHVRCILVGHRSSASFRSVPRARSRVKVRLRNAITLPHPKPQQPICKGAYAATGRFRNAYTGSLIWLSMITNPTLEKTMSPRHGHHVPRCHQRPCSLPNYSCLTPNASRSAAAESSAAGVQKPSAWHLVGNLHEVALGSLITALTSTIPSW